MVELFGIVIATFIGGATFVVSSCAQKEIQDRYDNLKQFLIERMKFEEEAKALQDKVEKQLGKNRKVSETQQAAFVESLQESFDDLVATSEEKQSIIDELTSITIELSNQLEKKSKAEYVERFGEIVGQHLKDKSKSSKDIIEQRVTKGGFIVTGQLQEGESISEGTKIIQKIGEEKNVPNG